MTLQDDNAQFLDGLQHIDVAGIGTELFLQGEGAPLLFLHGLEGIEASRELLELLAQDFRVIAPSLPGFGGTDLPDHVNSVTDLALFTLDLLDTLDIEAATFVGLSFGGWVALETLVMDPGRASQLVLGASLGLPTADRRERLVTDIFMLSPRETAARMQASPLAEPLDPAAMSDDAVLRAARAATSAALYGWSPYMSNPKMPQRLRRVDMPALVLWGEEDRIAPLAYGRKFADLLPRAEFRALPGCGHRIDIDAPRELAGAVVAFAANEESVS